jgi:hypothetical protein
MGKQSAGDRERSGPRANGGSERERLMDQRRQEQLAKDVWSYVFRMLDAEPDMRGIEAGRIATACESAMLSAFDAETDEIDTELYLDSIGG